MGKVVLITGASSGIGAACATHLARNGWVVYGTSRNPVAADVNGVRMIRMDVNDDDSVRDGIKLVVDKVGRMDAVVNNAGFGIAGAVEDTSIEEAKALFETNFFGILRVCRAVLPYMRAQGSGTIVNVSSIAGRIGLPYQGMYSATKFAVEGMTEALRMETRQFGIRVVLVEPGDFCTGFTSNRRQAVAAAGSPYEEQFKHALAVAEHDELTGSAPELVARLVLRILGSRSPRVRYTVGAPFQRLAAAAKGVLPSGLFEWALMKYYKLI